MITAKLCDVNLREFLVEKEDAARLLARAGPGATLPILELEEGTLITSSLAICRFIVEIT